MGLNGDESFLASLKILKQNWENQAQEHKTHLSTIHNKSNKSILPKPLLREIISEKNKTVYIEAHTEIRWDQKVDPQCINLEISKFLNTENNNNINRKGNIWFEKILKEAYSIAKGGTLLWSYFRWENSLQKYLDKKDIPYHKMTQERYIEHFSAKHFPIILEVYMLDKPNDRRIEKFRIDNIILYHPKQIEACRELVETLSDHNKPLIIPYKLLLQHEHKRKNPSFTEEDQVPSKHLRF